MGFMNALVYILACELYCAYGILNTGLNDVLYPVDSLLNPGAVNPLGGENPASRVHHTVTNVGRHVVLFGGLSTDGKFMDDIHLYDTLLRSWSGPILKKVCCNINGDTIEALGSTIADLDRLPFLRVGFEGDLPSARAEHSAVSMNRMLNIFGGLTADGFMNDMYSFDPIALRWSIVDQFQGPLPCRRAGHAAAERGVDHFVIFGGRTGHNLNYTRDAKVLNDVWQYNGRLETWTFMTPTTPLAPAPRQHAATTIMDNRMFMFGGYDSISDIIYNDVWVFHLHSQIWTQLSQNSGDVHGYAPPPLFGARLIPIVDYDGVSAVASDTSDPDLRTQGFLVYGGLGGGVACKVPSCQDVSVPLGQLYKFEITLDKHSDNSSGRLLNSQLGSINPGALEYDYIKNSGWRYARLSREDDNGEPGSGSTFRGKRTKTYALEAVAISPDRKLLYEFGGLQVIDQSLLENGQSVRNRDLKLRSSLPVFLDAGGVIDPLPSDLESGEILRTTNSIPFNGVWHLHQALVRSQPKENATLISFLREFRTYRVNPIDVVHLFQS